jgi:ArsR family transcriptional regulator
MSRTRSDPEGTEATSCCPPLAGSFLDESEAEDLAGLMKALADPVRLRLLSLVANAPTGEVCACDLAGPLGRSQPTVSHHLSVLTRAGLLEREQRGKWAWFTVDSSRLAQVADAVRLPQPS